MTKKQIIQARYKQNPSLNRQALADELGVNIRTVYRAIAELTSEVIGVDDEEQDLRKPTKSFDLETEVYIIRYGKNKMHSVEATNEQIRKAFMMHKTSIGNLTENQVSLEMKWTKREFQAIKHAFDFTKDAAPFTDHDIENMSSGEMAERERIEKKRYALLKLETKKHDDIKHEVTKMNKDRFWLEEYSKLINSREQRTYDVTTEQANVPVKHLIKITDEHSGLVTDNIFNTYNLDVMRNRFKAIAEYIISNIPKCELFIASCGDMVHGIIHGSTSKHSHYMMDSTFAVIDEYITLIDTLLENGYMVTLLKSNGSHSSIEKVKTDRTSEENMGRNLIYTLKQIYRNQPEVQVVEPMLTSNVSVVRLWDYGVCTMHGDENTNFAKQAETANKISKIVGYPIVQIHQGHIHHEKIEEVNGVRVCSTESLCGTDQYAAKLGLNSPCGFMHYKYRPKYERDERFVDLSHIRS